MSFLKTSELNEGGYISEPGNAAEFKTGDWRTYVPEFVEENCIHCMFCWIYCPDTAIAFEQVDGKPKVTGIIMDHCKGCGICAQECPPAKKGKSALVMVREEK